MPKRLPLKIFLKTFAYAPRMAVSLIIESKKKEVLLARRAIAPLKGKWHLPGGFVLKGESINECIKRVASKELGLRVNPSSATLLGLFDDLDKDPRGHVIDAIYKLKISAFPKTTEETQELKFFKKLPPRMGFNHAETLRKLGYK